MTNSALGKTLPMDLTHIGSGLRSKQAAVDAHHMGAPLFHVSKASPQCLAPKYLNWQNEGKHNICFKISSLNPRSWRTPRESQNPAVHFTSLSKRRKRAAPKPCQVPWRPVQPTMPSQAGAPKGAEDPQDAHRMPAGCPLTIILSLPTDSNRSQHPRPTKATSPATWTRMVPAKPTW